MANAKIVVEQKERKTKNGNTYIQESYVVWHANGFKAFSNYKSARAFYNELPKNQYK